MQLLAVFLLLGLTLAHAVPFLSGEESILEDVGDFDYRALQAEARGVSGIEKVKKNIESGELVEDGLIQQERNAITNREGRWPGGVVVYTLDETYSDSDRELIRSALEEFENNTCIRWIERTDEEVYVSIENDAGCLSEVGRIGGIQSVSLESPMCMQKGTIMHELMHTLGFMHEHSRSDRDNYIRVNWDNIIRGLEPIFEKFSSMFFDDQGLDYDYRSIMHYPAYMSARNESQPVLIPTNSDVPLSDLGSAMTKGKFTELDVKRINKFYECPSK